MNRRTIGLTLGLLLCPILPLAAQAQSAITEQEALSIAVDAYIYFYPLVTMDVTRKQLTNVEPGKGIGAPMNVMFNVPTFPTVDMRQVVRPNFDTLYSLAYLDLTKEPMTVSGRPLLPAAHARYVVGRFCVAGLAHHRNAGGQFPYRAPRLERNRTGRIYANRSAHSVRLDHWPH
jgi:hypothetical protein